MNVKKYILIPPPPLTPPLSIPMTILVHDERQEVYIRTPPPDPSLPPTFPPPLTFPDPRFRPFFFNSAR